MERCFMNDEMSVSSEWAAGNWTVVISPINAIRVVGRADFLRTQVSHVADPFWKRRAYKWRRHEVQKGRLLQVLQMNFVVGALQFRQ